MPNLLSRWRARWAAYCGTEISDDLLAAAIVTILLVPQSLAYALLAGLPPVAGVTASLLPILKASSPKQLLRELVALLGSRSRR